MPEQVCRCTGRSGFHPHPEIHVPKDENGEGGFEFWVCGDCDLPTEMYLASVMERT